MQAVRRGLRLVSTFGGRDGRAEFWPYCAAVLVAWMVVGNICFIGAFAATAGSGDGARVVAAMVVVICSSAVVVIMLAAAVARRLRDRGHSPWWAVGPLVPLVVGLALFPMVARSVEDDAGPAWFLALFGNNLVYFAMMIALVVQLALPTRDPVAARQVVA